MCTAATGTSGIGIPPDLPEPNLVTRHCDDAHQRRRLFNVDPRAYRYARLMDGG